MQQPHPSVHVTHPSFLFCYSPTRRLPPRSSRRSLSVLKFVKVSSFSVLLISLLLSTIPLFTSPIFPVVKLSLVSLVSHCFFFLCIYYIYIKDATLFFFFTEKERVERHVFLYFFFFSSLVFRQFSFLLL